MVFSRCPQSIHSPDTCTFGRVPPSSSSSHSALNCSDVYSCYPRWGLSTGGTARLRSSLARLQTAVSRGHRRHVRRSRPRLVQLRHSRLVSRCRPLAYRSACGCRLDLHHLFDHFLPSRSPVVIAINGSSHFMGPSCSRSTTLTDPKHSCFKILSVVFCP
jgi:hypothetical protein